MRRFRLWAGLLLCLPVLLAGTGCGTGGASGGDNGGGGDTSNLRVSFDAEGGNYATAEDEDGNQYTFRTTETESGDTIVTEANVKTASGTTVKASLDAQGRPVNFRTDDNTASDLVYDGNDAKVFLTDANGNIIEQASGIDTTKARDRVMARRAAARSKASLLQQASVSAKAEILADGLDEFEVIVEAVFDEETNPDSPLATKPEADDMREAALLIGQVVDVVQGARVEEVDRDQLSADNKLDEVPDVVRDLAGQTYKLFDAEGFCLEFTDVANSLTFDNNGVLQSEVDRHLVFPSFNIAGTADDGVIINYSSGTPFNLTPDAEEAGFSLLVTPVFTGTQVDAANRITIERRFQSDLEFEVDGIQGVATATATEMFDAAFINGELSPDGRILEFDLLLVDLLSDNPVIEGGRLRYRNQNESVDESEFLYPCTAGASAGGAQRGLRCPPENVAANTEFSVSFVGAEEGGQYDYDWFISQGYGFIDADPTSPNALVSALGEGFLEVGLIIHDTSVTPEVFEVFTCGVTVGRQGGQPPVGDLSLNCPLEPLMVGMPEWFEVQGAGLADGVGRWFVFGSSDFSIYGNDMIRTEIEFYGAGEFEVAYQAFLPTGEEVWASCFVTVRGGAVDECAQNGWYGDGECDYFCPNFDPDCASQVDICAENGWYGDGECDDFCPNLDPDCGQIDICDQNGWYGDGECDSFCPRPDPDCQEVDFCALNGWYGDGECDTFCPLPDPDCEVNDICAENGWYGDGECDSFCPLPDPDCDSFEDICAINGWYGDGVCDNFCPEPDPDCDFVGDICAENGWYGDGECDEFCPLPDPDCDFAGDICAENGWYGDGECDEFCPLPDPDCDFVEDICAENGWYGDGECDEFCPLPDPDCDFIEDICAENGWYGDGECDEFCPLPDPDCMP
jgi:YD repeat-containing protein